MRSSQQITLYAMPTGTPLRRTLSNTAASECSENRSSSGLCNATIYIRQNHVILHIAQVQHHPTFIGISYSLYISFIQASTQFVSASTMYAIQSNANSCMPSAPLVRSGSPPRCCKHLPSLECTTVQFYYFQSPQPRIPPAEDLSSRTEGKRCCSSWNHGEEARRVGVTWHD